MAENKGHAYYFQEFKTSWRVPTPLTVTIRPQVLDIDRAFSFFCHLNLFVRLLTLMATAVPRTHYLKKEEDESYRVPYALTIEPGLPFLFSRKKSLKDSISEKIVIRPINT